MIDRPVTNPIPKYEIFATQSIDEVLEYIMTLSGNEKTIAIQIAMLMLNACHQAVEDEILSKDIFAI
jgi:hypothetical protein